MFILLCREKMPYAIQRNPDGSYKVKNTETGRLASKKTTKAKAEAQVRILNTVFLTEKKK